jgi:cephalosporin hydroxylase
MTTMQRTLRRARELGATAAALPGAAARVQALRAENRQLKAQLRQRPAAAPAAPGADESTVREFHLLYRDARQLHKQTRWRGQRVIKCPLDLWVYQEILYEIQPDLLIETGTMYGGSAYYLASIMDLIGKGEVMTIDRNHREGRPQHPRISYVTGSSSDPAIVEQAAQRAAGKETVMVVLDSNHKAFHVLDELRAYHPLVTPGSYLVVEDTDINGHPSEPAFGEGPMEALDRFLAEQDGFEIDESREKFLLTYNPRGWLKKTG